MPSKLEEDKKALEEAEKVFSELEIKTARLLSVIYGKVNWAKIASARHIPWDIFQHRVLTAATKPDVPRFVERLCYAFGLQSISPDNVPLISELTGRNDEVMGYLRSESIPLCSIAILYAKVGKINKNKEVK